MTPLHMRLILEGVTANPGSNVSRDIWESQASREYRNELVDLGSKKEGTFRITAKGEAWLDRALATPMPVQKWVFEEDEK